MIIEDVVDSSGPARLLPQPALIWMFPLTVHHILRRMQSAHRAKEVVRPLDADTGECGERELHEVVERAGRLANALRRLFMRPG